MFVCWGKTKEKKEAKRGGASYFINNSNEQISSLQTKHKINYLIFK